MPAQGLQARLAKHRDPRMLQKNEQKPNDAGALNARSAFYNSVLPSTGLSCLSVSHSGLKSPPRHFVFNINAESLEAANTWNDSDFNVYHSLYPVLNYPEGKQ